MSIVDCECVSDNHIRMVLMHNDDIITKGFNRIA